MKLVEIMLISQHTVKTSQHTVQTIQVVSPDPDIGSFPLLVTVGGLGGLTMESVMIG